MASTGMRGVLGDSSSVSEDQTHIKWIDPAWPVGCLNRFSVLAYFESSPFFDASSLNRTARARGLDPAVPGVLESLGAGLEYVVDMAQEPNLFVIRKQLRRSGMDEDGRAAAALAFYYVIDNDVFQAPTLHMTLTCRIRRCLWGLQQGFAKLQSDLDPLLKALPAQGALTGSSGAAVSSADSGGDPNASTGAALAPQLAPVKRTADEAARQRWVKTDRIIAHVVNKYPIPALPAMLDSVPPIDVTPSSAPVISEPPRAVGGAASTADAAAPTSLSSRPALSLQASNAAGGTATRSASMAPDTSNQASKRARR